MSRPLYRIAPGNLTGKSKCWLPGKPRHKCNRKAKWYVFPAGEGTLDTTQFSNLSASPCDDHLAKACYAVAEYRVKK